MNNQASQQEFSQNFADGKQFEKLYNESRLILKLLPIGVAMFDKYGNLIYFNDAYIELFGIKDSESYIKKEHNIFKHPALPDDIKEKILHHDNFCFNLAIDFGDTDINAFYNTTLSTVKFFKIDYRRTVNKSEKGNFLVIISDITTQTIYQQKLEQNEIRTELTFHNGNIVQYDFDVEKDMFIIYSNDSLFSGLNEMSMDNYISMLHPDDMAKYKNEIDKMRAGDNFTYSIEYRIKSPKDTSWHTMTVTNTPLSKDANGKVTKYTGIRRDNTKWRMMMDNVEKTHLLLRTVIDRMPCIFFMKDVDDDYKYVMANIMFCNALGKSENEVIGYTDYQIMKTSEEADKFRKDDMDAVVKGFKSVREETIWKDGRKVWHTTKSLLTTSSGQRYLIAMSLDITSLDYAFDELKHAKEKAECSDVLKSAFLANMSHEIRTPLNAIVGFADLLISTDDKAERTEYGKVISNNSELLLKLINDILDMSKIEAGYIDFKNEKIDLSALFNNFYKTFSKRVCDNVKFYYENPYKSFVIEADKDRISQVVNNYISNAIKYTPNGSITIGYEYKDKGVRIYVKDTGIGIDDGNKHRVFNRFEKLDSFAQGTGLGLSICKVIVESMGGCVGFYSKKNEGSIFWAWIPCKPIIDGDCHIADFDERKKTVDTPPPPTRINGIIQESRIMNRIKPLQTKKKYL